MLIPKFCNLISQFLVRRQFSSALFITDDKAQKTFALLRPVIDFEKQLANEENLRSNISARCLDIDLNKLLERWTFFQFIQDRKYMLEHTRAEIGNLITDLMKNPEENKDEIEKLKVHIKIVKDDLKNVKTFYYGVEEDTMLSVLGLPNILHERTPCKNEDIIHSFLEKVDGISKSHMEIGRIKGYLRYIDSCSCFLKSDAALFEVCLLSHFRQCLEEFGYFQLVSPNFCRSVIVEGSGADPSNLFCVDENELISGVNRLYLCGGSSLFSFMAYFAKHVVLPNILPITCFSIGKEYQPLLKTVDNSLFNLNQQSVVSIFVATSEEEDCFESIMAKISVIYQKLGYHYRFSLLPASQLDKSESLHLSIQMFSNFLGKYVEVGNLSVYDSFLSKRLLFTYTEKKQRMFPKIVSGTLVNVPRVLGCLLENNSLIDDNLLTDNMKKYL